jgi:uncharacterized protein YegP (UPF0339 family)
MTDAIEVYESADGQWRYRVKGVNGEVIAQSEGYPNAFNANRGAQTLVRLLKDTDKPMVSVVDAQGMTVDVENGEVIITVLGPKNKDSYRVVITGEDLALLKARLTSAENAVPAKDTYLLSIIGRAASYTATPPTIDTLIEWVNNDRGQGVNPFDKANLDAEVREVVVDLFFERKIKTDNKKGLVVVEREGR